MGEPENTKHKPRKGKIIVAVMFVYLATTYSFMEHAKVTIQVDGEPKDVSLNDCLGNIIRGFNMQDFQDVNYSSWTFFEQVLERLDVRGERRALRTLNMTEFLSSDKKYTAADVKKFHRAFAREWHPDKVDLSRKTEAEEMMTKGNDAKGILEGILAESKENSR